MVVSQPGAGARGQPVASMRLQRLCSHLYAARLGWCGHASSSGCSGVVGHAASRRCSTVPLPPPGATIETPLGGAGIGARIRGVDLSKPLPASTVAWLLRAFHEHKLLCIAGQDVDGRFTLAHFERWANHVRVNHPHTHGFPSTQLYCGDAGIEP
jgi:hypothetical protein